MILNDAEIRKLCVPLTNEKTGKEYYASYNSHLYGHFNQGGLELDNPMITPFEEGGKKKGVISYGLTSAGYDLRLAAEFLLFDAYSGEDIDPKQFDDEEYRNKVMRRVKIHEGNDYQSWIILPPHSYVLARSWEYLRIPRCLKARCVGKSSYARAAVLINTTPLEPEWEGHLTIEIGNVSPRPARLYIMEGIAQVEFEVLSGFPDVSYKDKGGVYQGQTGVTPSRIR